MMTARTFRDEFPDYDASTLPAIPDGWQDHSWHNDACPKWLAKGDDETGLFVFVDYADASSREIGDQSPRFSVISYDPRVTGGDMFANEVFASDAWDDVLRVVEHFQPGEHCTLLQWAGSGVDCADLGIALRDEELAGEPGRLYGQGGVYAVPYPGGWTTVIENTLPAGELATVEAALYSWSLTAGYCGLVDQLAYNFARNLRQHLRDNWQEMQRRNASPSRLPGVCHSHDFTDANITMQETLEAFGISVFNAEGMIPDEVTALWGRAWEAAIGYLDGSQRLEPSEDIAPASPLEAIQPRANRFRAALERAEAILAASDEGDREHARALRAILDQTGAECFEPNCSALTDLISVAIDG